MTPEGGHSYRHARGDRLSVIPTNDRPYSQCTPGLERQGHPGLTVQLEQPAVRHRDVAGACTTPDGLNLDELSTKRYTLNQINGGYHTSATETPFAAFVHE